MILLIDNYDSFTYNVVQYLSELGADVLVKRNDALSVADVKALKPQKIVVSPGPCTPSEAGISVDVITQLGPHIPTLGICLGHQAIGQAFGGIVERAPYVMHGKRSAINHDADGLFAGLPSSSWPRATTRSSYATRACRPIWSRLRGPTTASSWDSSIANTRSMACSSTPSRL